MFIVSALLALRVVVPDTLPAPAGGAYRDAAARALVESARARRESAEGTIARYRVLSRARVSAGLRALGRDRLVYRCESAVRVDWGRGRPVVLRVLVAREVVPLVSRKPDVGDDGCVGPVFDPAGDRLNLAFGGMFGSDADSASAFIRHPLALGSEADYRFASGDTTTIRLPDGRVIRLLELRLQPRRSDPHLVSGSLWIDEATRAVVRGVLRLARPYDFIADPGPGQLDEDDAKDVPALLRPLRGDFRFIAIEYGLYEQRWWLPRLLAVQGEVQLGKLGRFPFRVEQSYAEYEVEGLPPGAPPAVLAEGPTTCHDPVRGSAGGEGASADATREAADPDGPDTPAPPGTVVKTGCECSGGRCWRVERIVPTDTAAVLASEYLPPSIYEQGEALVTEGEMRDILSRVERVAPAPWRLPRPDVRWGWGALDLARYNRVEGLSLGARADADLGRLTADATLRFGLADLQPKGELGATRTGPFSRRRAAVYRRLEAMGMDERALGPGASLSALLFGRDEGDYYHALGAELRREPVGASGVLWRAYVERQTRVRNHTDFSVPDLFGDASFRPNLAADAASQVGAEVTLRGQRGLDPAGLRGAAELSLRGEAGSYRFARPALWLGGSAPLPGGLLGSLRLGGGTSFGDVPVQSLWYLGGVATVRGYGGNAARGESFWLGRAEIATAAPGARLGVFSDAGWAGPRDALASSPSLLSVGAGASFLDGLLRLDVARALRGDTGWRLELYLAQAL